MSARSSSGGIGIGEATSVYVVATSDVVRAGLESLVANGARFTVVGSAADLSELVAQAAEGIVPDVVIYDVEGQESEPFTAFDLSIDEADGETRAPAFVVIGVERRDWLGEALRGGLVRAALPRAASGGEIMAAVEAVAAGLVALDVETFITLLPPPASGVDALSGTASADERLPPDESTLDALTAREREVLELLASGLLNKEIAWRMKISEHTVKFHVASIFAKFDVSTRTEAVMRGIRQGLIML